MFLLGGLGSPEYEITDLEDPLPDFSFITCEEFAGSEWSG